MSSQHTSSGLDERSDKVTDVDVEILLSGGHRYAVTLPSDSIILVNLVRSLAAKLEGTGALDAALFQIPLQDGRTALTFCDRDLAAITTTPPVLAQAGDPVWRLKPPTEATPPPALAATVIPTPWLQIDDVLGAEDLARLVDFVLAREAQLRPSEVTTKVEGYRRSRVLFDFPELSELVLSRVRAYLPAALRALAVPRFHVAKIEAQLTAQVKHVREIVFVHEQNVPLELEWDGIDADCRHVIAEDAHGSAIGTGRLLPDGHIGRMAVLQSFRDRGVGSALLGELIAIAAERGLREVVLNAQVQALAFYEKHGFVAEGEVFADAGIPHQRMRRSVIAVAHGVGTGAGAGS